MSGIKKLDTLIELQPCAKSPSVLSPDNYGSIIVVEVGSGPAARTFNVFKGMLTLFSTYFTGALKNHWMEGPTDKVKLPEDDPAVFSVFFHWLFTQKLYLHFNPDGGIPFSYQQICEVYVFGDARGIPHLCNAALDLLFQKCVQVYEFPKNCLNYVWEHTVEKSALRKFLVDFAVENYGWCVLEGDRVMYPVEFLLDVITVSRNSHGVPGSLRSGKNAWTSMKKLELCKKYHDHTT